MFPLRSRVDPDGFDRSRNGALAVGALHLVAPPICRPRHGEVSAAGGDRGYNRTVIYGLQRDDRTPEFYAAGRITYAEDGEPVMYVGLEQIDKEITRRGGPVLVFAG